MADAATVLNLQREAWRAFKEKGTLRFISLWLSVLADWLEQGLITANDADTIHKSPEFQEMMAELERIDDARFAEAREVRDLLYGRVKRALGEVMGVVWNGPQRGHRTLGERRPLGIASKDGFKAHNQHRKKKKHVGIDHRKRGVDHGLNFLPL
ncbi:MAG: hypothetical protein IRZ00_05220 [Gemmatimonadetes bacterium]|nr:hypothetical protein [Gemmatimonadota bacterium]